MIPIEELHQKTQSIMIDLTRKTTITPISKGTKIINPKKGVRRRIAMALSQRTPTVIVIHILNTFQ